ncbi:hypothetical protein niasHT_007753 [Heterodera trifolii]|uniref:Protein-L-isoaspartate O-methyltransferase domain-containing protein 1 n=1 Tax=Heterodera trifolii TaxID=157864 RepID=A0ABD2LKI7_9BILA
MGLTASVGQDNDELIDNLVSNDSLKTERVEKIMRLVDRGKFLPGSEREHAYKDTAWKSPTGDPGFFHMSAPCIYASVLENLDLDAGMSFLNIGSGTGYLSSMVGFIIGEKGISHGVELYQNVTEFANDHISVIQQSGEASVFDWCTPIYETGNAFQIEAQMKYDRIYCGALVPDSHRSYFCSFLKVGGVLILPFGHVLQRIVRKSEIEFLTRDISTVTFSHLIPVNPDNPLSNRPIKLPFLEPQSLRSICRDVVRRCVRANVQQTHKVEMRILCVESAKEERTRNGSEREGLELNWVSRRIQEHNNNRRTFGRRRRLQTIHFYEEDNEDEEPAEEGDEPRIIPNFHQNPMRHFLALVARDRLNQHHAARARQEAHQIRGRIRLVIGDRDLELAANPSPTTNEDVNYGFRFISENNLNGDENQQIPNIIAFGRGNGEADDDQDENNSEEGRETEQTQNTTGEEEEEDNETDDNVGMSSTENDGQDKLKANNGKGNCKNEDETKPSPTVDTEHNKVHQSASETVISQKANANNSEECKESNGENGTRISMKRQRRSHSVDSSPQQKRVFSRKNFTAEDKPSTSKNSAEHLNSRDQPAKCDGDEQKSDEQIAADNCECATEDDDDSSTFSIGQKNENSSCLTAEKQADNLREFHAEFARLLDTLPLNVHMQRFLKYEVN